MTLPRWAAVLSLAALTSTLPAAGQEPLRSGLQVGDSIPGSFFPLNINGADAGQKRCLV